MTASTDPHLGLQTEAALEDAEELGAEGVVGGATAALQVHGELREAARGLGELGDRQAGGDAEGAEEEQDAGDGRLARAQATRE